MGEDKLLAALPPPYDLVKLDIEGAEYDFVRSYGAICRAARAMVVEWHATSASDPRVEELRTMLSQHGLSRAIPIRPQRIASAGGPFVASGLELFLRESNR